MNPNERAAAFVELSHAYSALGWALVRCDGKTPKDSGWQTTKPELPELAAGKWSHWGHRWNLGVVCGPSGVAVLDIDRDDDPDAACLGLLGTDELPETPIVRTGRGRLQLYFRDPGGLEKRTRDGFELRVGPHQCVAPPSEHPDTGRPYEWLPEHAPWDITLAPLPARLIEFFAASANGAHERRHTSPADTVIRIGEIDTTLTSKAGTMRRAGMGEEEIYPALVAMLERCETGHTHTERDCRRIAHSVSRYAPAEANTGPTERAPVETAASLGQDGVAPEGVLAAGHNYEFLPIAEFLEHQYPTAEPLLGEPGQIFLAIGSLLLVYGADGSGKSTWTIDGIAHLGAGQTWLGIPVPRPVRICIIENEGPPDLFQKKLVAKIAGWDGPDFTGNLFAFTGPWGEFSFADPEARAKLNAYCEEHRIDLVTANPTLGLGVAPSGRPDETQQFVDWLVECGLKSTRAFWLLHHENKAGQISGDWGRHPDTKVQLQQDGNQKRTKLDWAKTRWATLPSETVQKICLLEWIIETQGYSVTELDTVGASDSELEQRIADYLTEYPASSTNAVWAGVKGTNSRIRALLDGDQFDCVKGKRGAKLWFLRTTATASGNDAPTQSSANPHE